MKSSVYKEKCVCPSTVVVDYMDNWTLDMQFSNFSIKYLCENEKVREIVSACLYEAQLESFKQKNNGRKSRDTVPLRTFSVSL